MTVYRCDRCRLEVSDASMLYGFSVFSVSLANIDPIGLRRDREYCERCRDAVIQYMNTDIPKEAT